MPKIKLEKVISFSTEDPGHPADNILDPDPAKKWKCQSPGERSTNIVLQLDQATNITSIDIGNENSAYIEVLVNRSSSSDDYKVLVVMSSFMTPLEARQGTNTTKVRMFGYNDLSSPERDEKWDRVKIVCTQPFNRHVQYGLSFVVMHSSVENKVDVGTPHIGMFTVRPKSPTGLTVGSLFARRDELKENKPLTAAAAIREASSSPNPNSKKLQLPQSKNSPSSSRNRAELMYDKDDEEPNVKIDALVEKRDLEKREKKAAEFLEKLEKEAKEAKLKKEKDEDSKNKAQNTAESSKRKKEPENRPRKKIKIKLVKKPQKPFHQLLQGVVFAISGIQNPERANIRMLGISMGAKYKPDWDASCTHLICAFVHTPKFNQVRGRGKIVNRDWIPDCSSERKRFPWRRYALDRHDQGIPESEDEICETGSADAEEEEQEEEEQVIDNKSGTDTEDEIERVQKKQWTRNGVIRDSPGNSPVRAVDNEVSSDSTNSEVFNIDTNMEEAAPSIYDVDTDVEDIDLVTREVTPRSDNPENGDTP